MRGRRGLRFWIVLFGLPALAAMALSAFGEDKPPAGTRDATKRVVERPVKSLLGSQLAPAKKALVETKLVIENPLKDALAKAGDATAPPAPEATNPKVEPGLVRWHPSFAAACQAASKSGKPVLLFQMMGNLDDRFC
jgi:hypothetical protein